MDQKYFDTDSRPRIEVTLVVVPRLHQASQGLERSHQHYLAKALRACLSAGQRSDGPEVALVQMVFSRAMRGNCGLQSKASIALDP